jgi:hypothetical protein
MGEFEVASTLSEKDEDRDMVNINIEEQVGCGIVNPLAELLLGLVAIQVGVICHVSSRKTDVGGRGYGPISIPLHMSPTSPLNAYFTGSQPHQHIRVALLKPQISQPFLTME